METLAVTGQVIFGLYWIYNGLNHFIFNKMLSQVAESKGIPAPQVSVSIAGILLLVGGLSVLTGMYLAYGIAALLIFLVLATFTIHSFWADSDPNAKMGNMINFFKNWALIGALLMLLNFIEMWPWVLYRVN